MTRVLVGDRIVATIDLEDGTRVTEALLHVDAARLLTCGCQRLEADRPDGGRVAVLRGAHCEGTS